MSEKETIDLRADRYDKALKTLAIAIIVFSVALFSIAWVLHSLFFKAAVYECHYGVDDNNVNALGSGYVTKNSLFVNGSYQNGDNIRCTKTIDADTYVCDPQFSYTKKLGYSYYTVNDMKAAGALA